MDQLLKKFLWRRLLGRPYKSLVRRRQRRDIQAGEQLVPLEMLDGKIMYANPRDGMSRRVYRYGAYEFEYIYLLYEIGRTLDRLGVAIDIGANIGNHLLFFADIFKRSHAFEPNPAVFDVLTRNIEINNIKNVTLHMHGLSDEHASSSFVMLASDQWYLGRLASTLSEQELAQVAETFDVEVRPGDETMGEAGPDRVDCMKLDIEGHEIVALRGLAEVIQRHRPYLQLEYQPDAMAREGGFEALQAVLPGYRFFLPDFSDRHGVIQKLKGLAGHYRIGLIEISSAPTEFCRLVAVYADSVDALSASNVLRIPPNK